jgi:death on curing protein
MRLFYLDVKRVLQIHDDVIEDTGGGRGIRDFEGIEAAIVAPQTSYFGEEQYPTIAAKGAALGFILVTRHPFMDGNKRVGHAAMAHFLFMNGFILDADDDEQELVMLQVASGVMDLYAFTEWIKSRVEPIALNFKLQ